jgi:hypothetical protein
MQRFVVTTQGSDKLGLRQLCQDCSNDLWIPAHLDDEQAAALPAAEKLCEVLRLFLVQAPTFEQPGAPPASETGEASASQQGKDRPKRGRKPKGT